MNIEDLTKTQLLLLTLLVNFVTSIATGVLTVSLLDQAPATVVQTVNRIVDHTIETVTTQAPGTGTASPVVPSSEELLTNAIAETVARTVHLYRAGVEAPVALGVFVPSTRSVFTVSDILPGNIMVKFADGTLLSADAANADGSLKRYAFSPDITLPSTPAARLVPGSELKQGQSIIALDADGGAVTGIVSRLETGSITTDLPGVPIGAAATNLSGNIIGIGLGNGTFYTADRLAALAATP